MADLDFSVGYRSSLQPGGMRPGGEGAGQLTSTIEFIMPADEVTWGYYYSYGESIGFEGKTDVLVQDVTDSETLAHLTVIPGPFENFQEVITGRTGHLIRVSMIGSAEGSTPPGITAFREYRSDFVAIFTIPEPGTLWFLIGSCIVSTPRRRSTL